MAFRFFSGYFYKEKKQANPENNGDNRNDFAF